MRKIMYMALLIVIVAIITTVIILTIKTTTKPQDAIIMITRVGFTTQINDEGLPADSISLLDTPESRAIAYCAVENVKANTTAQIKWTLPNQEERCSELRVYYDSYIYAYLPDTMPGDYEIEWSVGDKTTKSVITVKD